VIAARFEHQPGQRKIARKEYVFQDQTLKADVNSSMPFERAFLPGRRINMSMIFGQVHPGTSCPSCMEETHGNNSTEIK
jgi:hypothetical protein